MKNFVIAAAIVTGSIALLSESSVAQMTQKDAPESKGRRICRTQGETGSMAARRRVCLTKAEWDRTSEEQRRGSRYILEGLDSCGNRGDGGTCPM